MRALLKISTVLFILSLLLLFTVLYIEIIYPSRTSGPFPSLTRVAGTPITHISIQLPQILEDRELTLKPSDATWNLQRDNNQIALSGSQLEEGQTLSLHIDVEGFVPAGTYPVTFQTIDAEGHTSMSSTSWIVKVNYLLHIYSFFLSLRPILEPLLYILTPLLGAATLITIMMPEKAPLPGLKAPAKVMQKNFTQACQAARNKAQDAYNSWKDTLKVKSEARRKLKKAERELKEARDRLTKSKDREKDSNKAWDDHISKIKKGPHFGIQDVKADFQKMQFEQTTPEGGIGKNIVGPIRIRNEKENVFLLGPMSKDSNAQKWSKLAEKAMLNAEKLQKDSVRAQQEVKQRQKEVETAEEAFNDAQKAFDNAEKSKQDARNKFETILKELKRSCAGQTETSRLDGCEIEVHPGVLPEDEKRVTDVLKKLEEKELKNLKKVFLLDKVGPDRTYIHPKTKKRVKTKYTALYLPYTNAIKCFVGGHKKSIIKHEVGHHVQLRRLDDKACDEWTKLYEKKDNKLQKPKGKMPTEYAENNECEGFAETYEYFYDRPKQLDPEVLKKMNELLERLSNKFDPEALKKFKELLGEMSDAN